MSGRSPVCRGEVQKFECEHKVGSLSSQGKDDTQRSLWQSRGSIQNKRFKY